MGKFDLQWAVKVCMWKHCLCLMKRRCQVTAYQTAVKRHFTTAINVVLLLGRKRLMFLNTSSWDSWGFEKLLILTEHPAPFCCVSLSLRLKAGSKKLCEVLQRDANVSFCCPIYTAACVYVLFIHLWLMAELVKHGNKTPAKKKCHFTECETETWLSQIWNHEQSREWLRLSTQWQKWKGCRQQDGRQLFLYPRAKHSWAGKH